MRIIRRAINWLNYDGASLAHISFFYVMCQVLIQGVSFIFTPFFSRAMDQAAFGDYNNYISWENLLGQFVCLGLATSIPKIKYELRDETRSYAWFCLLLSSAMVVLVAIFFNIFPSITDRTLHLDSFARWMLLINLLLFPAFSFQQTLSRSYNQYRFYVLCAIVIAVSRTLLSVVLVLTQEDKYHARLIGYTLPALIVFGIIYLSIWTSPKMIKPSYWSIAYRMGILLLPAALAGNILGNSDRIMIRAFCDERSVALYSIPYTMATAVALIQTGIGNAFSPWMFDRLDKADINLLKKGCNYYQFIYLCIAVLVMALAPELLLIMGGQQYYAARWVMPPVILGMVSHFYYSFYYNVNYFYGKSMLITIGVVISAILNIMLNALFLPRIGYIAAAYTTLFSHLFLLVYGYCILRFTLKKSQLLNNRQFFLILLLSFAIQLLFGVLYEQHIIRYIIAVVFSIIIIIIGWKWRRRFLPLF